MSKIEIELLTKLVKAKEQYTFYDLSRLLGFSQGTIFRWLKTNRIQRGYAKLLEKELKKLEAKNEKN